MNNITINTINNVKNTEKQFFFLSGIARSGSTLLAALINQNPEIYCTPTSPLLDMLIQTELSWKERIVQSHASGDKEQFINITKGIIQSVWSTDRPYVLDKHRAWARNILGIKKMFGIVPKIIVTVRDIPSVFASFIRLIKKTPGNNYIDHDLSQLGLPFTMDNRINLLWDRYIHDVWTSVRLGYQFDKSCLHFVEYDDLMTNPQEILEGIYKFLELPLYGHDTLNIINTVEEKDEFWGLTGLHDIRKQLKKTALPPEDIIGQELFEKYANKYEFWRNLPITKDMIEVQNMLELNVGYRGDVGLERQEKLDIKNSGKRGKQRAAGSKIITSKNQIIIPDYIKQNNSKQQSHQNLNNQFTGTNFHHTNNQLSEQNDQIAHLRQLIQGLMGDKEYSAAAELGKAILHKMNDLWTCNAVAESLYNLRKFDEALKFCQIVYNITQADEHAVNLSKCLYYAANPGEALKVMEPIYERAKLKSGYDYFIEIALDYSLYLSTQGYIDRSEQVLRQWADTDNVRIDYNLGWFEVMRDFKKGMFLLTSGIKARCWGSEYKSKIEIKNRYVPGMNISGKRIMVMNEGGLGDEIMFGRFAQIVKNQGAYVIMRCSKHLMNIFNNSIGVDETVDQSTPIAEEYDYYIPMMSAPTLLDIDSPTKGIKIPYIFVDTDLSLKYKKMFEELEAKKLGKKSLRIALRWHGNIEFEHDQFRTYDPNLLFPELNKYGTIYSVQRDHGMDMLDRNLGIYDLSKNLETWEDTLAILDNMDLLITSCTSIAHANLAAGKNTIVISPVMSYYYLISKNIWYPNLLPMRQPVFGDWNTPTKQVIDLLEGWKEGSFKDYFSQKVIEDNNLKNKIMD